VPRLNTHTVAADCEHWKGHVIVCGLEGVGLRTVEQLRSATVRVAVVDDDPQRRWAELVKGWGCAYIGASGSLDDELAAAGIAGARAVVCTQASDLRNVETALLVRDLREDIAVVAHLDNPTVGHAVEEATGAGSALDVAGLFAPAVIDACMKHTVHEVVLGDERFVAAEVGVGGGGTLRQLFGDLVPVGVVTAEGELVVCPGRDHEVGAGDRVTVLGKPEELEQAEVAHTSEPEEAEAGAGRVRQFLRRSRNSLAQGTDRAVKITLVLSLAMLVLSAAILRLGYIQGSGHHLSIGESLYFTVETFATVGFGDFSFADQSTPMQAFGIVLIIAGVTLSTVVLALITNALVSRRIEQSLGQGSIPGMENHVILVGLGAVGLRVLEGLRAQGREVVVVEYDESNRYVQHARSLGAPLVHGDATLGQTLRSVNIAKAGAVAILTSDDLVNLETGLAVRDALGSRWSEVPVVLRVFDRSLGSRLERTFKFNHVWSTAALASPWFVGAVLGLEILATFYVRNQPFLVARLTVRAGGGLEGLAMQELGAQIRVVAIVSSDSGGEMEHPPRRDTRFAAGDQAYLLGPYEELLRVLTREREGGEDHRANVTR
jgi:Trk K+ transport system NAD-binding subunit/multidrug transporter EmrE-like cation transporter